MRKIVCITAVSLALAFAAEAQVTNSAGTTNAPLITIGAADAISHYNQTVIVTGKVAQVTVRPAVTILSIDKPFTNALFTAVVFSRATNRFGDLTAFQGKTVAIQGVVRPYRNRPEIIMNTSNQLSILSAPPKP